MATSVIAAITYARQQAQTDDAGIPSVLGLAFANDVLVDFHRELAARRINASGLNFNASSVLLANTTSFTWPTTNYALKTIEINYTDSAQGNYLQAMPVDISNLQGQTSFDWLRVNQPATSPLFANYGATWEAFPTPTSNALVKFVNFTTPTEYPDVGTAIGYPLTLDYRILSFGIVNRYSLSQENYSLAQASEQEYLKRVAKLIEILAPPSEQPIKAEPIHLTGWQF